MGKLQLPHSAAVKTPLQATLSGISGQRKAWPTTCQIILSLSGLGTTDACYCQIIYPAAALSPVAILLPPSCTIDVRGLLLSRAGKCLRAIFTVQQRTYCDESQAFIVATFDSQDYLARIFGLGDQYQVPSPASSSFLTPTASSLGPVSAQQLTPPNLHGDISPPLKQLKVTGPDQIALGGAVPISQMPATEHPGAAETAAASKPKRVRTGCLTCRERHLKCDEGIPNCNNCQKSSRVCKRGVRLNFIDTTVRSHPLLPPTGGWKGLRPKRQSIVKC